MVKIMAQVQRKARATGLGVFIKRANAVPFEEGLRKVAAQRITLASNARVDDILTSSSRDKIDERLTILGGLSGWMGTMSAYGAPGEKLGEKIEYVDQRTGHKWIFPVPKEHKDKRSAIMIAEHSDYFLEIEGNNRVVHVPDVKVCVLPFPTYNDWFLTDPVHRIPVTENGDEEAGTRYLMRAYKRVGPVLREYDHERIRMGLDYAINLEYEPSYAYGLIKEAA